MTRDRKIKPKTNIYQQAGNLLITQLILIARLIIYHFLSFFGMKHFSFVLYVAKSDIFYTTGISFISDLVQEEFNYR